MPESVPPIDMEDALERTGNDLDFLMELFEIYRSDFHIKADELETALHESDFKTMGEIGHYLKGSSANLSMGPLRDAAYRLEQAGNRSELSAATDALKRLKRGFADMERFLDTFPG